MALRAPRMSMDPMPSAPNPVSKLWGEWTDIEVKAATVIWVNRLVIGLDLCPFALASMPGLRVVVSSAMDKEQALDTLAEEMGYLAETPKDKPATTLVVFPPALFDKEQNVTMMLKGLEDPAEGEGRMGSLSPGEDNLAAPAMEVRMKGEIMAEDGGAAPVAAMENFVAEETQLGEEEGVKEQFFNEVEVDEEELRAESNFANFMEMAYEAIALSQDLFGDDAASEMLLLTFHPNSTFSSVPFDPADFALRSPFPTVHLLRGVDIRKAEESCERRNSTTEEIAMRNEARLRGMGYRELVEMLGDIYVRAKGVTA
ncbi:hypothetical protein GUITHDRAFT_100902 [Guillardia theta CCMP2712]|uniref:Uncharacterized protein n=1 Tax=Guillardia theta (strain CCMP2712) TaxID=905079 RepID=L1JYM5_GUITC|nr:hypothetical protein GUITHDRAFT_100902 [Guillardia theta CCMP2712]EKX53193.1 hypothetical protein GUITHDRAFT_100902 [Guillardia theta CCMP2712]|eukprot:XP_005840173.1 hypothetical protein GUITHDRAFT_100902 [Guillardia theta CCMP2712]